MLYGGDIVDISKIKDNFSLYKQRYYNFDNLKIEYWTNLYKKYGNNCKLLSFWNLRYFHKNISNQIKGLTIPYLYMCYYKEKIIPRNSILYLYQPKANYKNEQLYIYFFYQLIYQIFKIIDNTYVCLNKGLNLGIDQSRKIKENEVVEELKKGCFGSRKSIIRLYNSVNAYKGSKLEYLKESYRNKYTHDFIIDIPKAVLNNMTIEYEFFDVNTSFKDIMKLLKILEKHLKNVEMIIKIYINNKGLN